MPYSTSALVRKKIKLTLLQLQPQKKSVYTASLDRRVTSSVGDSWCACTDKEKPPHGKNLLGADGQQEFTLTKDKILPAVSECCLGSDCVQLLGYLLYSGNLSIPRFPESCLVILLSSTRVSWAHPKNMGSRGRRGGSGFFPSILLC